MPRIRSKLARMEPSNEAWTIRISFYAGQQEFIDEKQCTYFGKSNAVRLGKINVSIGLVKSQGTSMRETKERVIRMIWDSIDMIMPLRGLLALSCLDLSRGRHTCCGRLVRFIDNQGKTYNIISSTAFPNVTFISAPIVSPILFATLSVA
jgi:hypothetical protein